MYIITGGAGFIGSACLWRLNQAGVDDILVVDNLGDSEKWKNLVNRRYRDYLHKSRFLDRLESGALGRITAIIHMGACSATTETDADFLMTNNLHYSQRLARYALEHGIRFINASSAATYGNGDRGFSDAPDSQAQLKPLNMYGYSKHLFDLWALRERCFDRLASLKFFNVYGPNEYHKGDMCSVVFKAFHQVAAEGVIRLFKSYRPDYSDGGQQRDFIYVKDCVDVIWWLLEHPGVHGLFNVGTGQARTWYDLAAAVFAALKLAPTIEFKEMPDHLRDHYQYFTCAEVDALRSAGYDRPFTSLEAGVSDYVTQYLQQEDPYL
ncbi:MAG: ADP-glyceromanno-heptose 6-epimerase [Desulfosarcinaceae bacterium]|nr:ADP-glyceromanno-heptose 6-epimerase [Desulfosarcinaceae bacterium]